MNLFEYRMRTEADIGKVYTNLEERGEIKDFSVSSEYSEDFRQLNVVVSIKQPVCWLAWSSTVQVIDDDGVFE